MQYIEIMLQNKKEAKIIEQQIIGTIGTKEKIAPLLIQSIKDHWFINPDHRELYKIVKENILKNESPISDVSKAEKSAIFAACMEFALYSEQQAYALPEKLKHIWLKHTTQETLQAFSEIKVEDPNKEIASIWAELTKISEGNEVEQSDFEYIYGEYKKVEQEYIDKAAQGKSIIGYETGFKHLDDATDGLRDGHLQIWGGYTSAGKTFAVLNVAYNLMLQNIPVSIYSLEMSKVDIFKRMLGVITEESSALLLKKPDLDEVTKEKKEKAIEMMRKSNLKVHTERFLLDEIMMNMIIEKQTGKAKVFIIDYAQLVTLGEESEYDTMRLLATRLQHFCRKHNVPVILVSQVSNESAKNPENNIIGFKGSGALAASADVAIELMSGEENREARDEKIADGNPICIKMVVKKNRHGRIFNTELWFQPRTGRFYNEDPSFF